MAQIVSSPRPSLRATVADLWRSSSLIQGIMALMGFGTICYLEIVGRQSSQILAALVGSIIGFYFGTKKVTTTD